MAGTLGHGSTGRRVATTGLAAAELVSNRVSAQRCACHALASRLWCNAMKMAAPAGQSGAVTLLVAITLVMLAALASFYSTRSVLMDQLASQHQSSATQARLMAEAALAWGRAELARQSAVNPDRPQVWEQTRAADCPQGRAGPRWQCSQLQAPAHPGLPDAMSQVVAVRDLLNSPHVAELHASASLAGQNSHSQVQASVLLPVIAPAPLHASTAALVLNGCAAPAAGAAVTV